jgi:site-specific recombinase XerD
MLAVNLAKFVRCETRREAVQGADHYLRHLRFARGRAESTTKTYAGNLKRFEQWRADAGLTWEDAARDVARYLLACAGRHAAVPAVVTATAPTTSSR